MDSPEQNNINKQQTGLPSAANLALHQDGSNSLLASAAMPMTPPSTHTQLEPQAPLRIAVVDDFASIRSSVIELLEEVPSVKVVGEAADAPSAVELIQQVQPDLLVLDVSMPGTDEFPDGLSVLRWCQQRYAHIPVIILSNLTNAQFREECLKAGAYRCLDKSHDFTTLPSLVQTIHQGGDL